MNFDWNNARTFIVTAELGSLSAAAQALGVTQPTAGRQVAALEASLHTVLFERTRNKLILTPHGKNVYESLKDMKLVACNARLTLDSLANDLQGSVTIAASQIDALYRLPPILAKLHRLHPEILPQIDASNKASDLLTREADIAIRSFRPAEENLIARKLRQVPVYFYAHTTYRRDNTKPLKLIGFNDLSAMQQALRHCDFDITEQSIPLRSEFQPMHIPLALEGVGCAILPADIGDNIAGLTRIADENGPVFNYEMWLVCHQELRTNSRIKTCFEFLAQQLTDYV